MAAATPALTPAQSAGEQFGGAGGGGVGGSALAAAAPPRNITPANATAPTASATARCPRRPDGNTIAPSPSSSAWRIHRAVARVEGPWTTEFWPSRRRTAVDTDVEIAVGARSS